MIAIIGIVMLVGIVKKNAIMMIDVALERRRQGVGALDAIREAALLRFRPIMMTTLAAIFGVLPIALGAGAGSELRQPLASPWWAACCCRNSSPSTSRRSSISISTGSTAG